jgi:uncharacterized protein (DUF58 family)
MSPQKRKPLDTAALAAAALAAAAVQQPDPVQLATAKPAAPPVKKAGASRAGRVQIQGYFPEETRRALKMLAVRQDRTVEDLLAEAIVDVLAKHAAVMN